MSFSTENPIHVGLGGLGFMGRTHLGRYRANPLANVAAVADIDPAKLSGHGAAAGNIGGNQPLDLTGVRTTTDLQDLIDDPTLDAIDLCLPTRLHAEWTIAALSAGKHVLCEKPMAWTVAECDAVIEAQRSSGKFVLIGHCLRFWPQYVHAESILRSGTLGRPLYAQFHRSAGVPNWSGWIIDGAQSGGAVLDMHVHDIDIALWWFGTPQAVRATGVVHNDLPLKVDATWTYLGGPTVQLHGGWDIHGAPFRMSFDVMCENGTISWGSSRGPQMEIRRNGEAELVEVDHALGYGPEIDYFLECISTGSKPTRASPETSRQSVEIAREELCQIGLSTASA